jgi:pimeloyl-ACP methyl ester carboxylesterase
MFLPIQSLNINYTVSGEGAPVVLLHGWGCDLRTLDSINRFLTPHFKVYALDFPGFGRSQTPTTPWGTAEYTTFVKDFLTSLNIENPILIGHSFGGRIILRLAKEIAIRKIIITGGAGMRLPQEGKSKTTWKTYCFRWGKSIINFLPFPENKKENLLDTFIKKFKFGSADYQAASPMLRKILVKVVNEDLREFLPYIKTSTLLIYGENDTATPLAHARIMEKEIADAGLVVIKNAGHYAFLEKSSEFLAIVGSFLINPM